ncbi:hypothetical protein [Pedobacter punctiformis]|uniref:BIG2 domain-containing protein n=1 Tax=Pedobacter punctiformis TaxID=3004097 RepID=A0ABT4L8V3_9SPHI|nr:hypothetical protein [Pedobacter sp. HCMS5-2]MCZ4244348.1 hypothetical protein [Pedobacter sp. HCMS5-2]
MKTSVKIIALFALIFCVQISMAQVTIEKNGISIAPGTKISSKDKTAMNNILRQYDSSLYNVKSYASNGRVTSAKGKLANIQTSGKLTAAVISGRAGKASMVAADCTLQITVCNGSNGTSAQNGSQATQTNKATNIGNQQRLIAQLTTVLSKYQ